MGETGSWTYQLVLKVNLRKQKKYTDCYFVNMMNNINYEVTM